MTNIFPSIWHTKKKHIKSSSFNEHVRKYLLLHNWEVPSPGLSWQNQQRFFTYEFDQYVASASLQSTTQSLWYWGSNNSESKPSVFSFHGDPKYGSLKLLKKKTALGYPEAPKPKVFGGAEAQGFRRRRSPRFSEAPKLKVFGVTASQVRRDSA